MKKRREKTNILLCLIIVLSFLIRIWQLDKIPAGFFCDEASIGYNAYLILKTGRDEWGKKFPIFFKAFGEYKSPLDIYFTIIPVAIFGLNEFSVRLTSVFFNTLSILIIFLIGKKIKNDEFGFLSALFFSISPWSIHFSRVNFELQVYLFFFLISFLFLIKFIKGKKEIFLFLASFLLAIASYSYFPARIFVPLFFLLSTGFLLFTKKIKLQEFILSFFTYTLICIPLIYYILIGQGLSRFYQVSLFNLKEIGPIKKIALSYLLHFSPDFLFIKGDAGMNGQFITRHSVLGFGQFYIWQAFFVIWGILNLIKKRNYFFWLTLFILILYPFPSSITVDITPQATRSIIGLVPFTFLIVEGFYLFFEKIKKLKNKLFLLTINFIVILIISFSFYSYLKTYFNEYSLYSSDFWGWQYGPKEIMNYFVKNSKNYDELYMSGEFNGSEIFLKFYDPENMCQGKCKIGDLWRTPAIYNPFKKQLFSLSREYLLKSNFVDKFIIKKIIYYPNGQEAFLIGEVKS